MKSSRTKSKKASRIILDILLVWILIGICIACSPTKRYNRLLEKYPLLEDTTTSIRMVQDTITTITTDRTADTVFTVQRKKDTVFWVQNHDSIIIKYRRYFDTVMIEAECPPDTIIEIRKVPYVTKVIRPKNKIEKKYSWIKNFANSIGWIVIVGIIIIIILFIIKKFLWK